MEWPDPLTGLAFRTWILAVTSGGRISQGQRLDPFATSMRNFTHVSDWLSKVERGEQLEERGGSGRQNVTDLRGARLLEESDVALSELGRRCLTRWRSLGIASEALVDELPRCLEVVQSARAIREPEYGAVQRFWREVRSTFDPDALFAQPEALYVLSYMNRTVDGFNPWHVIKACASGIQADTAFDWDRLTGAIPASDRAYVQAVNELKRRIDDAASRGDGRLTFCMAMELFELGESEHSRALEAIRRWEVPL